MSDTQQRVTAAVEAFGRGEIVVVTDDDDRENEGDLVMAAVHATPEKMAFIIRNTCGIVCAPLPAATAHRLRLAPMVAKNDAPHGTAFTVTVDYKHGARHRDLGRRPRRNSAQPQRRRRCRHVTLVLHPGHVPRLIAEDGGVLMRSGHAASGGDQRPVPGSTGSSRSALISKLVNDDGSW